MSIAPRLKQIREDAGVGLREMARRLGMSPSTYRHYEDPSRFKEDYLPFAQAKDFAKALKSEGMEAKVLALAGFESGSQTVLPPANPARVEVDEAAPANTKLVPVLDISASAGHGALAADFESVDYTLAFPPDYLRSITRANPRELAIISVKGDSMVPTLKDDDLVMVDLSKTNLGFDGLFVLRFDGALHVKRISRSSPGFVTIISDNRENYPPIEYPLGDVETVGKVIWKGGKV